MQAGWEWSDIFKELKAKNTSDLCLVKLLLKNKEEI